MKIKAKNTKAVAGCRLIVPFDGLITIDNNGIVEVSESCANALVKGTSDWDFADSKNEEKTVADETENEVSEREKFIEALNNMTVSQMKELCKEGGFPEDEWKNLKKATLASYLIEKFDEADSSAEEEEELEEEETAETELEEEEVEEEELEEEETK